MRVLIDPRAGVTDEPVDPAPSDDVLAELYAAPSLPWLRVNMVSSVDGAVTGVDGKSGSINNEIDRQVFAALRGLADAVVVGAGTARVEALGRREHGDERERSRRRADRHPGPAPSPRAARAIAHPTHDRVCERVPGAAERLCERDHTQRNQNDVGIEDREMDRDRDGHRSAREVGRAVGELDPERESRGRDRRARGRSFRARFLGDRGLHESDSLRASLWRQG